MAECKDCFHFKVCAYADHYLPVCDSFVTTFVADVAPVVHGEWEDYGAGVCCSKCGISLFHQDTNNNAGIEPSCFEYCPYCGAKMDLEENNG